MISHEVQIEDLSITLSEIYRYRLMGNCEITTTEE